MRDGQDLHGRFSFAVNYGKRKALDNESPRRVLAEWQSLWRLDDKRDSALNLLDKIFSGALVSLDVPCQR